MLCVQRPQIAGFPFYSREGSLVETEECLGAASTVREDCACALPLTVTKGPSRHTVACLRERPLLYSVDSIYLPYTMSCFVRTHTLNGMNSFLLSFLGIRQHMKL